VSAPGVDRWRPTFAVTGAVGVVAGSLILAVLLRRADLVVVATPVLVGAVAGLLRTPPGGSATVRLHVPDTAVWEDDLADASIVVGTDSRVDLARVAVVHDFGVRVEPPGTLQCVLPRPDEPARTALPLRALRWGRHLVGPAALSLTAAHGLLRRDCTPSRTEVLTVLPLRAVFDATDSVPNAAGLVGTHRSRMPGSGTDLLSIRPFAPGDRLRRITWPVSLRTRQLHVTTTTDDRDTDVYLIVDTGADVGDRERPPGTSLDITVRSAASVAEHYLRQGDRVGLLDLGSPRRPVRPGAGRRHLLHVFDVLLGSAAMTRLDPGRVTRQLREVPPRALVMVFSTLLDDWIAMPLAQLAKGGHSLLVVDTLPPGASGPAIGPSTSEWAPLAWRLALLNRDDLRHRLAELGIPVVAWQGAGSLDHVLRGLSRAAAAPRRRR
jgi:uncharacterized protein (DUF58 family)